jgi:hypothetical protein
MYNFFFNIKKSKKGPLNIKRPFKTSIKEEIRYILGE